MIIFKKLIEKLIKKLIKKQKGNRAGYTVTIEPPIRPINTHSVNQTNRINDDASFRLKMAKGKHVDYETTMEPSNRLITPERKS